MIVLKLRQEVSDYVRKQRADNKQIGFVATMGALHAGHLSLIDKAASENDLVICSIFVNPLQFNDKSDFEKYPNTLSADLELLKQKKCDLVFAPDVTEMYANEDPTVFDFGNLDKVMEGVFRPGHFLGMAKVVKRLFDVVNPHKAYFGEKDFQQLAIIRKFSKDLNLPVQIIGCPIQREADGLAMSSRNTLLSSHERHLAPIIYATLMEVKKWAKQLSIAQVKEQVKEKIESVENFKLEYFEVADSVHLNLAENWNEAPLLMGFIVVRVGKVRLIDNIAIT